MPRYTTLTPFWILQLIAWLAYGLITFIGTLPYIGTAPHLDSLKTAAVSRLVFACAGLGCTCLMRLFYQRADSRMSGWARTGMTAITFSYVAGLFSIASANLARQLVSQRPTPLTWSSLLGGAINAAAVFLAWTACYFAIRNYQALEKEKLDTLQAAAQAHRARLELLRTQVSPHFLFNALNSIHALVKENPDRAQRVVEELAEFMRYSLTGNESSQMPLADEIELLERYLRLEKVRFEEKISVTVDIAPPAREVLVPGFILHPLLENAIKYGMQTSPMPLQIRLSAGRDKDSLWVAVANTGRWVQAHEEVLGQTRTGRGLKLVRQRLEQAYPGLHQFECHEQNGWVENVIVLQLANQGPVPCL